MGVAEDQHGAVDEDGVGHDDHRVQDSEQSCEERDETEEGAENIEHGGHDSGLAVPDHHGEGAPAALVGLLILDVLGDLASHTDECGEKGVYIGTVEEDVSLRFVPLDVRRYECLELDAGSDLSEALPEHTENDIYRIILTGESEGVDLAALHRALDGRFYALELRDATVPPLELWTRCGETTLEGMSLHTLRRTLDRCETDAQRRRVELAARRIVEVCEGREAPAL